MNDLLEILYRFTLEHRIDPYLDADPDYVENTEYGKEKLDWLKKSLSDEAKIALNDYTTMHSIANSAFSECLFRAALVLGFELHHM